MYLEIMSKKTIQSSLLSDTRRALATTSVILSLMVVTPRKAHSEEFVDSKFMYYQEDNNRIRVLAPSIMKQFETESGWTIKVDGIYNAISGATPTGAPPVRRAAVQAAPVYSPASSPAVSVAPAISTSEHESNDEEEHDSVFSSILKSFSSPKSKFSASTGATPVIGGGTTTPAAAPSTPASSPASGSSPSSTGTPSTSQSSSVPSSPSGDIPVADFSDTRWAFNLGLSKRVGQHSPGTLMSFSQESDYQSLGLSLQDAIDFNRKNTTLLVGGALTHDAINPANGRDKATKDTVDALLGITQVLTPTTLLTANIAVGQVTGFISDPYKVVELNGNLTYEKRPDSKTKQIVYLGINQFITPLDASIELGVRHYGDSFGISAETLSLAWYQKLGTHFILSPSVRYYTQTAADFYDVRFSGSPEFYSSDYRVSAFTGTSFGLKLTWLPTSRFSLDTGVERYQQKGDDGITDQALYTGATVFIVGAHWAL
jgi:hypothetical protein